MHKLHISDFDKAGWCWTTGTSGKCMEKVFIAYMLEVFFEDDGLTGLHLTPYDDNCNIKTVQINIDEITTVQEIEETAEALYNAIQGV